MAAADRRRTDPPGAGTAGGRREWVRLAVGGNGNAALASKGAGGARRSWASWRPRSAPDHLNVHGTLVNLGHVLGDLGDLPAARDAFERALVICEERLGSNYPDMAGVESGHRRGAD